MRTETFLYFLVIFVPRVRKRIRKMLTDAVHARMSHVARLEKTPLRLLGFPIRN